MTYLNPGDPGCFDDLEIKTQSRNSYEEITGFDSVACPMCKGHGMWNLRLNAYGPGKHFQACCNQCNGWGWVTKGSLDETCIHDYKELSREQCLEQGIYHWGMFCHVYQCCRCNSTHTHDSSG